MQRWGERDKEATAAAAQLRVKQTKVEELNRLRYLRIQAERRLERWEGTGDRCMRRRRRKGPLRTQLRAALRHRSRLEALVRAQVG